MTVHRVSIAPRAVGERPLSRTQSLIWTSQRLAPGVPLANMATAHRISGVIDADRFAEAFDRVVRASDTLRTVVVDRRSEAPRARVLTGPPAPTSVLEISAEALDEWCRERIAAPIDVTACGYDSVLIRHAADDWTWWLDLHHAVTDAWASATVFGVVAEVYAQLGRIATDADGPNAVDRLVSFYDHVARQTSQETDAVRARRNAFWAAEVAEVADQPPIAPFGPRARRTTRVTRHQVAVAPSVSAALDGPLRTLSRQLGLLGLLATAMAVTLHRLDGRSTVTLGVPFHHRSGPAAPLVIGPLMELYPLRVQIDHGMLFGDLFARVQSTLIAVMRHARPGESPDAAFDAIVNVLTSRYGDFAGLPTETRWERSGHVESTHPLRVQAYDFGHGLQVELDLNASLSSDGAHHALPGHFAKTLAAATGDPACTIGGYDLVADDELVTLDALNPSPATPGPVERDSSRPIHVVIAELLRSDPGRVTAEHDGETMTAGELDRRADALASWLGERGVGRHDRVGVRMPRSLDVLVAVHGILRVGAAFVMMDPDDPPTRHDAIAADAGLVLILDRVPVGLPDGDFAEPAVDLDDIAYVLYTSGSTGSPKGVPIPHRGLNDYLAGAAGAYATHRPVVMPLHSALIFDLSITSLFLPQLTCGTTVVVGGDPLAALSKIAEDRRLTVLKATPSQLELLSRMITEPLQLDVVIVGGEAFRRPVAESFARRCRGDVRIYNEYGPTEAVVGCMIHEWDPQVDTGPDVPIGRASPGAEVFILDAYQRRTPLGAWGELYVRRPGMSTGYLHLPEQTAERFETIDSIGGGPVYRTGDRVRVERGVVLYGGRTDDQIKFNGVRLEPGEIEAALVTHPGVVNAIVRVWSPGNTSVRRCVRCGLGTDVPDLTIDGDGVCSVCQRFSRIEPQTRSWFRTPTDLDAVRVDARARSSGAFDCLHLLSGGKDSTYALYQLVEQNWRVHALTLDNGYISDGAKANISRTVADLGISHEFVTTEAMNAIFRDSLDRYANVCNGCYKTIYTLATARAHELGIPVIVTGLSRGQFFETRLVPHQFETGRFDADAIDHTVLQARRAYHSTHDTVTELLPQQAVFERTDIDVLAEIAFVDYYRYVDVELAEMYAFLAERAPWVRPDDTGRSTNCLVNVVGIHVHRTERGYHNYAEPYSWDVRLGHKTRREALDELDDEIDHDAVERMLAEIGYQPKRPEFLTAWYQTVDGRELDQRLLSSHLRQLLPSRSIPSAFVHVDDVPLAGSTKLDVSALPTPTRRHAGSAVYAAPTTTTEAIAADIWAQILGVDRVGVDDDFFDLGGASLAALETVAAAERRLGVALPDALVFDHRALRDFAAALDDRVRAGTSVDDIPALEPADPAPLSAGEEAMLFEYRAAPQDTRYNVTRLYTIHGGVDEHRLRQSIADVVTRHGPLRTAFDDQRTPLSVDDALTVERFPSGPPAEFADSQRRVPFDLDTGPLVRVHLGVTAPDVWSVLVGMHHVTIDAGTFDNFWNEVDAIYHGRTAPLLTTTYAAHGAWQRARAGASADFWAERTAGEDFDSSGPLPNPATIEPDGYLEQAGPVSTSELAAAAMTTPFGATLAAAAIALRAYSRVDAVELGITASTKDDRAAEPLVGYFLNTLPMVLEVDRSSTLRDVDALASRLIAEALPHRAYPFASMVRSAREQGRRVPSVAHMLAYERLAPARFGDAPTDHRILASGTAISDLSFIVQERGDLLRLGVEHRGTEIGESDARRVLDTFSQVLEAMCRRPHHTVDEILSPLAGDDLAGPPLTAVPPTVLHRILDHVGSLPDRLAVVDASGSRTTYAELGERATAVASHIRSRHPDAARIGIALPRSASLVESVIGVLLSGAAFVPLDPTTPTARLRAIVAHADLDAVIVDASSAPMFADVPRIEPGEVGHEAEPIAHLPGPDDAAYLVFTSGSTGEPAGVVVTHANLAASTAARRTFYGVDPPDRFLLTPSIGFDSSMVGLFWPLASGGAIVVPDDDDVHDVDRLAALIARESVTHTLMVPSLYRAMLLRRPHQLRTLRTAIVAGEPCPAALVDDHHRLVPEAELVNEYGPTEATVWATAHRCEPGDELAPIGRPIAGARVRVADVDGRSMAPGAAGELMIAGPGVTAGYASGRSNATFFDDGERRWYRTGDRVRVDGCGRLLFLGRVDDQLNVGGLRLEPAEVEAHLAQFPGITEAVVVRSNTLDGREQIVAHVIGDRREPDDRRLRSHLADRLVRGAIPRHVVFHDDLPRTVNGKIDRRKAERLSVPEPPTTPSTGGIHALLSIWRAALGRPDLTSDGNFFEAGGDSLAAVEIVTALGVLVGRDVPIATLLSAPTPSSMAEKLGVDEPVTAGPEVRLLTLRLGNPGGPAVLMTPAWDSPIGYRDLANAFPDHVAVHALVVVDDGAAVTSPLHRVGPFVDASTDLVREWVVARASVPYAVVGWSIGGVVAFEIGQRLGSLGDPPDTIGLIDTFFPGEYLHLWSNRWWKYKSMLRPGSFGAASHEFMRMGGLRLRRYGAAAGRRLLAWSGEPVPRARATTSPGGVPTAALEHRPTGGPVPVVLYSALSTNPRRTEVPWRTVAPNLRVVKIDGRHRGFQSVMGPDRVHQIVDDLMLSMTSDPS